MGIEREMTPEKLFFFNGKEDSLPLYEVFLQRLSTELPDTMLKIQRTQIGLYNRHLFGAVFFLPVRRARERPAVFLAGPFGPNRAILSPRIDGTAEPYPGRWTHHVMLTSPEDVDGELMGWMKEVNAFSAGKQ